MNNRKWQRLVLVAGLFFVGQTIFAASIGMVQSGVDLNTSQVQIDYTKFANDNHTNFECLGDTVALVADTASVTKSLLDVAVVAQFEGDVTGLERFSFADLADNENIMFDIDDPATPSLRNCFQQAGDYTVTVTLFDALGNSAAGTPVDFQVKATDADATQSIVEDTGSCSGQYANNSDRCQMTLNIRDTYDNNLLELNASNVTFYDNSGGTDPWGSSGDDDEANLGTSFYSGLKHEDQNAGEFFKDTTSLNAMTRAITASGTALLRFVSIVPTLQEQAFWQGVVARDYPITAVVPAIDTDGSVLGSSTTFDTTVPLTFDPPLEINAEILPGLGDEISFETLDGVNGYNDRVHGDTNVTDYDCGESLADQNTLCPKFNAGQTAKLKFLQNAVGFNYSGGAPSEPDISAAGTVTGQIQRFHYPGQSGNTLFKTQYEDTGSPTFSNKNPYSFVLDFFPADSDDTASTAFLAGSSTNQNQYDSLNPDYDDVTGYNYAYFWDFVPEVAGRWFKGVAGKSLEIRTIIDYTLDSQSISYYAGAYGINEGESENTDLDILIEGFVTGDLDKIANIDNLVRLGNTEETTDTREIITANAFKLIRGTTPAASYDFSSQATLDSAFASTDTVVVNGDVKFETGVETNYLNLPSGRKTLVILDGNLLIANNLQYANPSDSFGFILVNSESAVDNTSATNAESSYSETGNIFVHSDVMDIVGSYFADGGIMTQDDIPTGSDKFENVTHVSDKQLRLTGALMSKNTIGGAISPDSNDEFVTPWGKIENDVGLIGDKLAKRYDLRLLRIASYDTNDHNYQPGCSSGGPCTDKETGYPFLLRFDRKSTELPPPGFSTNQTIGR